VLLRGAIGPLDSTETTRVASIVTSCWDGALTQAKSFCLVRDDSVTPHVLYLSVSGYRTLSRAEARTELAARRPLTNGLRSPRQERCEITGPRLKSARDLQTAHYGPEGTLVELCAERTATGWSWVASLGVVPLDEEALLNRAEAGEDIYPVQSP
jgi:hypothetical protein